MIGFSGCWVLWLTGSEPARPGFRPDDAAGAVNHSAPGKGGCWVRRTGICDVLIKAPLACRASSGGVFWQWWYVMQAPCAPHVWGS
jgi:hypothetical protein